MLTRGKPSIGELSLASLEDVPLDDVNSLSVWFILIHVLASSSSGCGLEHGELAMVTDAVAMSMGGLVATIRAM